MSQLALCFCVEVLRRDGLDTLKARYTDILITPRWLVDIPTLVGGHFTLKSSRSN